MTKQVCANCHFLVRQRHCERGPTHTVEVSEEQRKMAARGDFGWQRDGESLGCHKGIWDEGLGFGGGTKAEAISKRRRNDKCYFFEFQSGTFLPAAEKLQQERLASAQDSLKYRVAIYGLAVTIIGLVARLIYERMA